MFRDKHTFTEIRHAYVINSDQNVSILNFGLTKIKQLKTKLMQKQKCETKVKYD